MTMTTMPQGATPVAVRSKVAPAATPASAESTREPAAFAPLLAVLPPQPPSAPQATTPAAVESDTDAIDVLDASLMQAIDEMLGRSPAAVTPEDEATPATPPSAPPAAATLAMLMPTMIPAEMPPAPAIAEGSRMGRTGPAGHPGDVPQALPMSSALMNDTARWMTLQADAQPAANDTTARQGLQRWSAELMSAMTSMSAVSPTAAAGAGAPSAVADAGLSAASSGTLTLPASREAWQQPLMQALGDRLQLQIAQRAESARLHLEPPQLGRIEIDIRQQGGVLQVQFNASHDEVRQQLRQIAEPLRQDLVQRHAGEVSVQVAGAQAAGDGRGRDGAAGGQGQSSGQGGQNSPQRDAQRQPGRALHDEDAAHGTHGATAVFAFADALDRNTRTL